MQRRRRGQVSKLSIMMGAMFISCGITHLGHLATSHAIVDTYATTLSSTLWIQVIFDIATAIIAIIFLSLRKSYGIVIDGPNALVETKDKLKIKNEQLQALYQIISTVDETLNLEEITQNVLVKSSKILGMNEGAIYLIRKTKDNNIDSKIVLWLAAKIENTFSFPKEVSIHSSNSDFTTNFSPLNPNNEPNLSNIFSNVIASGKIFLAENKLEIQRAGLVIPNSESLVLLPLRKHELVGLFLLYDIKPRTFIKEEIAFLEAIGSQIGNAIEKATLYMNVLESKHEAEVLADLQKEFINIASHEMRTPVQSLLGYAELLKKHPEKNEMITDSILRNAQRLQRLTNDILDVSRIESKSLKLHKERFNLSEVISTTIFDIKSQLKNGFIKILFEPQLDYYIEADKARLIQVVSNLLINAIKFTKAGAISIDIEKKGSSGSNDDADNIIVSIKDSGNGISLEILPRLFAKFATKSEKGGTGLGLFISKGIVEAHGGKIWAQNNSDGIGATFAFSLPIRKEVITRNIT